MLFSDFALAEGIVLGLAARGITIPSPIQEESLPFSLEGRDILGRARTGTGKTLAFALPIITRVQPSRERSRLPRDLLERRDLDLTAVEVVVLDEADEMLSMGFQEQVETILSTTPQQKQTMLFSATMPRWVERIANKYQTNPKKVDLVGNDDAVQNTTVQHVAVKIAPNNRTKVLADLLTVVGPERAIIFTRTKRDCGPIFPKTRKINTNILR